MDMEMAMAGSDINAQGVGEVVTASLVIGSPPGVRSFWFVGIHF